MTISIKIIIKRFYIEKLDLYAKMMRPIVKKVQQDILENVNVLKSKNKNYKKYNGFHNYKGRYYSKEVLESLYANGF